MPVSAETTGASRVVILGGGFAGAYCAQALESLPADRPLDVTLIDRNNYFLFYPLLVEAGTGSLEPRHVVVSIRSFLKSSRFRRGQIEKLDLEKQTVFYRVSADQDLHQVPYDDLVIALGSVTRLPNLPGLKEHGFQMKSLQDAVALRDRAIDLLERANASPDSGQRRSLLHFVVVGGSFTGVEVAGEFDAFLKEASRLYDRVDASECTVTLIEIADRILPALEPELSGFAARQMEKRGIRILLNESVTRVCEENVLCQSGQVLDARTVIWCAGIAPNPLIADVPVTVDEKGYILCERDLRVKNLDNVWAIGDCAVNTDGEHHAYPATAQHAVRQGKHLARNLAYRAAGRSSQPCNIDSPGSLAAIGCRTGVARVFGMKLAGFPAWFLHRTVYLLKMPGWSRKLRVALDWTIDLLFSRDYVQLGVHRR